MDTALGNIKTALAGTYHHVSAKHAQRYLTSFAWRFNRRYQLDTLTERLAYACARTPPHPVPGHHRRIREKDNQESLWYFKSMHKRDSGPATSEEFRFKNLFQNGDERQWSCGTLVSVQFWANRVVTPIQLPARSLPARALADHRLLDDLWLDICRIILSCNVCYRPRTTDKGEER